MNSFNRRGIIFVVSAPSGTGKSTLCNNLNQTPDFVYSVSCTTRAPRPGEEDGIDYRYLTEADFEKRLADGDFLEYARVHEKYYYGTLRSDVLEHLDAGTDVLLDIDVQGARQIRASADPVIRDAVVDVFIMPPTIDELERRLRKRGTENEAEIQTRLASARKEMPFWREYKYTLLSGSMEEDLTKFRAIMRAERYRTLRLSFNSGEF